MHKEDVQNLVEKYIHDLASNEEKEMLLQWYKDESNKEVEWELDEDEVEQQLKSKIYTKIIEYKYTNTIKPKFRQYYKLTAAALVLIFFAIGFYFYSVPRYKPNIAPKFNTATVNPHDIEPGGNKAILTLADGSRIELDESKNGILVNQGSFNVRKNADGVIAYIFNAQDKSSKNPTSLPIYNTIETPVGGKYQLILADGTQVWLNSASSLRFPVVFNTDSREVELKGEAYFEVSKDVNRKFSVRSKNQTVEVLGTHFNINAYSDESAIRTTLLEGEVRVIELNSKDSKLLKPGEQSIVDKSIQIENINIQAEIAWKEGYFNFTRADIETVMRQLGRWYGVHAKYEGTLPEHHFSGAISTDLTLLEVLEILEKSNIHFKLEGKEVTVMP